MTRPIDITPAVRLAEECDRAHQLYVAAGVQGAEGARLMAEARDTIRAQALAIEGLVFDSLEVAVARGDLELEPKDSHAIGLAQGVAQERERCAQVLENFSIEGRGFFTFKQPRPVREGIARLLKHLAAKIRKGPR